MGKAIPAQHPAVVLRSHYKAVQALLAVAMIAVVGLTIALVIVASDGDDVIGTSASTPAVEVSSGPATRYDGGPEEGSAAALIRPLPPATRYDGGPEEGSRGPLSASGSASALPPATRYDGGPEEGTRGPLSASGSASALPPATRYDGGPEEGSRGPLSAAPPATRYDGGPEEGTRGL